eukprot:1938114-Lingulodinium_polyedra.AAC.1
MISARGALFARDRRNSPTFSRRGCPTQLVGAACCSAFPSFAHSRGVMQREQRRAFVFKPRSALA